MPARKNRPGKHTKPAPVAVPSPLALATRPRVALTTADRRVAYTTTTRT